jgi:amino acid transporter
MGNFWGFQEAWLSLVASIFDMAIYPTLFVAYLTRLFPWIGVGHRGVVIAVAMVALCAALNIAGIYRVVETSLWLFVLLTAPFVIIIALALTKHGALASAAATSSTAHVGIIGGILVSMWNYMGWDNASTVAAEVHEPSRTYPRAMFAAVAIVAICYIAPFAAMRVTGISPDAFETGSWANIAELVGGHWLSVAVVAGGTISAFGMFNALVMSYSRLPLAMAQDGLLPSIFARTTRRSGAPWVAIIVLAAAWAMCLGLGFEKLVTLDILLYGGGLLLEFVALAMLRITEPDLPRPYRVPGGVAGAFALVIPVALLLGFSVVESRGETVFGMNALFFGTLLILAGFVAYPIMIALPATQRVAHKPTESLPVAED